MRAQSSEHGRERVGGMGVIDDDRGAGAMLGDELQPAGRSRQSAEPVEQRRGRRAGRERQPEGRERVHRLEFAGERHDQLVPLGKNVEEDGLAAGARPAANQPQIGGRVAAIGENWRSPLAAQGREVEEIQRCRR